MRRLFEGLLDLAMDVACAVEICLSSDFAAALFALERWQVNHRSLLMRRIKEIRSDMVLFFFKCQSVGQLLYGVATLS